MARELDVDVTQLGAGTQTATVIEGTNVAGVLSALEKNDVLEEGFSVLLNGTPSKDLSELVQDGDVIVLAKKIQGNF